MNWTFRVADETYEFLIEVDTTQSTCFKGSVVQINWFENEKDLWYQSNTSSDLTKKRSEARVWFQFLWIWRGCWEGRIYFIDDEFWSDELAVIHTIWQKIEPILKARMKELDAKNYIFGD